MRTKRQGMAGVGAVQVVVLIAIAAAAYYYFHRGPHGHGHMDAHFPVANTRGSALNPRMAEFEPMFQAGTPLESFARPGEYTVVEVYLDVCAYCREMEAALAPFNDRRPDVSLVRVHHPGHIGAHIQATSREEMQAQVDAFKSKMESYGFCGSPHVEVFGPDRKLIARDSCKSRAGSVLIWDWIGTETGIKPKRSASGVTGA